MTSRGREIETIVSFVNNVKANPTENPRVQTILAGHLVASRDSNFLRASGAGVTMVVVYGSQVQ